MARNDQDNWDDSKSPNALVRAYNRIFSRRRREKTSAVNDENTTDSGHISEYTTMPNSAAWAYDQLKLNSSRRSKYTDYENMARSSVIFSRALDIISQNIFMSKDGDKVGFEVKSDNAKYEKILLDMNERVGIHMEFPGIVRSFMLRGDSFDEVVFDNNKQIVRVKFLNPYHMVRCEDEYGRLKEDAAFAMVDDGDNVVVTFEEWQIIHHRFNRKRGDLYGTSLFDVGRRNFRALHLMEDGVIINRFTRAHDRLLFKIPEPSGNDEMHQQMQLERIKRTLKRRSSVDSQGKLDLTKAPYSDNEDFFLTVSKDGPQPDIVKIAGSTVTGNLADVEYFQNLNVMSTGIPKAYFALERDVNAKSTLDNEDLQFAKSLRHYQSECARWYLELATRQLQAMGYIVEHDSIEIVFPPISFIDEQIKMSIQKMRWETAALANNLGIPMEWILEELICLPASEVDRIMPNLKPAIQQQSQIQSTPSKSESDEIKGIVYSNMNLSRKIGELRDMISFIDREGLSRDYSVRGPN